MGDACVATSLRGGPCENLNSDGPCVVSRSLEVPCVATLWSVAPYVDGCSLVVPFAQLPGGELRGDLTDGLGPLHLIYGKGEDPDGVGTPSYLGLVG